MQSHKLIIFSLISFLFINVQASGERESTDLKKESEFFEHNDEYSRYIQVHQDLDYQKVTYHPFFSLHTVKYMVGYSLLLGLVSSVSTYKTNGAIDKETSIGSMVFGGLFGAYRSLFSPQRSPSVRRLDIDNDGSVTAMGKRIPFKDKHLSNLYYPIEHFGDFKKVKIIPKEPSHVTSTCE